MYVALYLVYCIGNVHREQHSLNRVLIGILYFLLYYVYLATLIMNNFERTMEMLNAKMDIQDDERLLKIARRLSKQAKQTGIVAKLKRTYAAKQKQPA